MRQLQIFRQRTERNASNGQINFRISRNFIRTNHNSYRELAAQTVYNLLNNPVELEKAAINRVETKEESADVAKLALDKYSSKYHPLFATLKAAITSAKYPNGKPGF